MNRCGLDFRKNHIRTIVLVLLCVCTFATVTYSFEDSNIKILHLAGDIDFPPFEYVDESGDYRGFNVDVLRAIAIEEGFEIKFTPMTWEDALVALENGTVDGIQGMKYSKERSKRFYFTDSYITTSMNIFVRKDNNYIKNLNDLSDRFVAVQRGDISNRVVNKINSVKKVEYQTQEEALMALSAYEVDAFVGNRFTGLYNIQKNNIHKEIKIIGSEIDPQKYGVALGKESKEWINIINQGIKKINDNGTYTKIYNKWFGEEIESVKEYKQKLIYGILVSVFAVTILFLLFYRVNAVLKRVIRKQTTEIEEESLFKEQIINSIFSGLVTIDKDGVIMSSNTKVRKILNFDIKDLVGKNYQETVLASIIDLEEFSRVINKNENLINIEKRLVVRSNERPRIIEYNIYPLAIIEGDNIGVTLTIRDITKDKELREKIIVKDKLESIGQMTTSIAHEIRNPLSAIKTYTELLPYKYENEEFRDLMATDVPREIERLDELLSNLLDFSKPAKSNKEKILISDILQNISQLVDHKIREKGIRFDCEIEEGLFVNADSNQLIQIILNLVLNGVDAVETSKNPVIEVNGRMKDNVVLTIKDNGCGISEEDMNKIFEPFYSTKTKGYGLGLSIVHQLLKENNIELNVESGENGTVFELLFS